MNTRSRGLSLISVIFLIVVVAVIGAFMVTMSTVQRQTSTYSILSTRAQFAAQSGMQWAIKSVLDGGACFVSPTNLSLSGGASDAFNVEVQCTSSSFTETPDTYNVYALSARATQGSVGDPDFISRTIRTSVTDAP